MYREPPSTRTVTLSLPDGQTVSIEIPANLAQMSPQERRPYTQEALEGEALAIFREMAADAGITPTLAQTAAYLHEARQVTKRTLRDLGVGI